MPRDTKDAPVKVGFLTAGSLVVANMVGTGIFTSLGFQVTYLESPFALLMLWVVGGVMALCGALTYGELGAALPRSGGEYHLLSQIYHPSLGFLAGWISATLGFAGPIALAAIAFGEYTSAVYPALSTTHLAAGIVIVTSLIHGTSVRWGSWFQNGFTALKVLLILVFIGAAATADPQHALSVMPAATDWAAVASPGFAVSLVFVSYAYTGWNAAVYIVGEIRNPSRNLPRALLAGTALVLVLYVLLNYVFLYTVPASEMANQVEVGYLSGRAIFGAIGGQVMAVSIALLLVSTVSAMVFLGPRITQAMGEDIPALRVLATTNDEGIPVLAVVFQAVIALAFIYTSTFEQVLIYAGFTLTLMTSLTVAGVFVLRVRRPGLARPYRTWGYPVTPALFLLLNAWVLVYVFIDKPSESLVGLGIVAVGVALYIVSRRLSPALAVQVPTDVQATVDTDASSEAPS
jgi:APA family basic amino acid/polyamine antiporter